MELWAFSRVEASPLFEGCTKESFLWYSTLAPVSQEFPAESTQ